MLRVTATEDQRGGLERYIACRKTYLRGLWPEIGIHIASEITSDLCRQSSSAWRARLIASNRQLRRERSSRAWNSKSILWAAYVRRGTLASRLLKRDRSGGYLPTHRERQYGGSALWQRGWRVHVHLI
jgi:hypothetical protein